MSFEGLKTQMFRQPVTAASNEQKEALGTLRILDDGRKFRYAKNGAAALTPGLLVMAPLVVADHVNIATAGAAAGALKITVTLGGTGVTEDQYAGGFLQVNDAVAAADLGFQYRIVSHPAADAAGTLVLTLDEPIVKDIAATAEVSLIGNPYANVVVTTGAAVRPVGLAPTNVAAGQYFWAQTGGLANGICAGASTLGSNLVPAAGGKLDIRGAQADAAPWPVSPYVGYAYALGVADEAKPVWLTLD